MKKYFLDPIYRKALMLTTLIFLALTLLIIGFLLKPLIAIITLVVLSYGTLLGLLGVVLFNFFVQHFREKEEEKRRKKKENESKW